MVISRAKNWSKNAKNVHFDQWIQIIQSGALTLYRDIFNDYLWSNIIKLTCQHAFWPALCSIMIIRPKIYKKCQTCQIWIIQSGALTLYTDIFNYYLWSHRIESDMPARVLTWIGVYGDLQGHELVNKCQKWRFWSLNSNYSIWCLNIMPRYFQWLSMIT